MKYVTCFNFTFVFMNGAIHKLFFKLIACAFSIWILTLYASVLDVVGHNAYEGFVLVLVLRYCDSFYIYSMSFHLAEER